MNPRGRCTVRFAVSTHLSSNQPKQEYMGISYYLDRLNEVLDSLTLTDNKCHFNRVRENEALISFAALSIAYSGVFHSYINALTLFFSIALINPNNIKL